MSAQLCESRPELTYHAAFQQRSIQRDGQVHERGPEGDILDLGASRHVKTAALLVTMAKTEVAVDGPSYTTEYEWT